MNKNIGRKFFSITCVGLVVIGISLFNIGKNKGKVEDLYGKRSELGDVSILLQSRKGMYETDEIKINKDSMTIDSMAKQAISYSNLSKKKIDSRKVLEAVSHGYADYSDALLEDDDKIASVFINSEYTSDGVRELFADIKIKYDNSNEVKSYKISMGENNIKGSGLVYSSVPISIDNDNIYITTFGSYHKKEYEEDNMEDVFYKTELNLYKINLSNKESKHILTKEYDGKDIYVDVNMCFANDNKSYFLVKEKDYKEDYKSSLFEFDVMTKDINIIDLGTKEDSIKKFSVDDNKLFLLSVGGIEDGSENEGLKYGRFKGILVNLENSKVEHLKHIDINTDEDNILQIRRLGNKIYFVYAKLQEDGGYTYEYSYYISVFDEDKNEITYKGRIKQNSINRAQVGIIKKEEM